MILRIVRACHAALYREFLPEASLKEVLDPDTHTLSEDTFLSQHRVLCKMIKENRKIDNIDQIKTCNSPFQFDVVWAQSDDGAVFFAAFAMNIYDWHRLGDGILGRPQGCLGSFRNPDNDRPEGGAIAASIDLPYTFSQPLNPFE